MKKLLFIAVMIMAHGSFFLKAATNTQGRFFKNENGEFFICREIGDENEECINIDQEEAKKLFKLVKENEEQTKEIIKNICIAQVRNAYFILLGLNNQKIISKNKLQKISHKEVEKLMGYNEFKEPEVLWNEFNEKKYDPEYVRSMLPEEEQKMFDAIKEMDIKLKEEAKKEN